MRNSGYKILVLIFFIIFIFISFYLLITKETGSENDLNLKKPLPTPSGVSVEDNTSLSELVNGGNATQFSNEVENTFETPENIDSGREYFFFDFKRLRIETVSMVMVIEDGLIVFLQDVKSGEIFHNINPSEIKRLEKKAVAGFTSERRDFNQYLKSPDKSSRIVFSIIDETHASLTYYHLKNDRKNLDSILTYKISIDRSNGDIILQVVGFESDPTLQPNSITIPLFNMHPPAIILGNGARYTRNDKAIVDQTTYSDYGLYSPSVAVVEGENTVLALWSETANFTPEYIKIEHNSDLDSLFLFSGKDLKQEDPQLIISPPWRFGFYSTWVNAARKWRENFEERTGARKLWENRSEWVQKIHVVYDATNTDLNDYKNKIDELGKMFNLDNLMFFLWNGDRIVLFGDHTLVRNISKPTPELVEMSKQYDLNLVLYHPYTLIYSDLGTENRLKYLSNKGWLPKNYQFLPDYQNSQQDWQLFWSDIKTNYYDGSEFYILHPGSKKFKEYFVDNIKNYLSQYHAKGAYLDISGCDFSDFFPDDKKIIDGQDYVLGEVNTLMMLSKEMPEIGLMSEYQSIWILPYVFFSWEGSFTHLRQIEANRLKTRINHPLRVALVGSYSWMKESNSDETNDVINALLGTLPEVSLVGDYQITEERALWSQARAKLFYEQELFNDIPDVWDSDALAYYRSKSGNWYKFKYIGDSYGYVELLPNGEEAIRLIH